MPRTAKTPEQRIKELKDKEAKIKARIAKENAKISSAKRKEDTRRKIVAGAIALENMQHDPAFKAAMKKLLAEKIERPEDKKLFASL